MQTKRTGTISISDATRTHHTDTSVRELVDGTIEYYVGGTALARDGYATLPGDLVAQVRWNVKQDVTINTMHDLKQDGAHGYTYNITMAGVLLAQGWTRAASQDAAVRIVNAIENALIAELIKKL